MTISFSFVWFFILFILQVMSLGIHMGKLGEVKITKYSPALVLISITMCTMTGLSLYWWPS